jgi:signal transduction histidine kinase
LGLAIVRTLVEAQGGTVAAGNHAGGGAELTVTLPAVRPDGTKAIPGV